jgi:hypothetical protein
MTEETPITAEELQELYKDVSLEQLVIDEILKNIKILMKSTLLLS